MRQRARRRHVVGGLARRILRLLHDRRGARARRRRHDHGHLRARTCRPARRGSSRRPTPAARGAAAKARCRSSAALGRRHPGLLLHRRKARRRGHRRRHGRLRPRSAERPDHPDLRRGTEGKTATFAASSTDGEHVFFNTIESLVPADEDGTSDVYEWSQGAGTLEPGHSDAVQRATASAQPSTPPARTPKRSSSAPPRNSPAEDTDGSVEDIYAQEIGGGERRRSSRGGSAAACGNGAVDARFDRASADARDVVFTSHGSALTRRRRLEDDIYSRDTVRRRNEPDHNLAELLPAEKRQLRRDLRRRLGRRQPRLLHDGRALHPRRRRQ